LLGRHSFSDGGLQNSILKGKIMATEAQIAANRKNAQHSAGATSEAGKFASARNNFKHGLSCPTDSFFTIMGDEDPQAFAVLELGLRDHYQPQDPMEIILVRRMTESEWLRARAVRMQNRCMATNQLIMAPNIALFLRYQTTHERAFYKALKELQTLRQQRAKTEIGFESQKLKQAAEVRANVSLNLRQQMFEFKKQTQEERKSASQNRVARQTATEIDPRGLEMVA
jgi:hypothetical protein